MARQKVKYPIVSKKNELIEAKYKMSVSQQKLVLACISFIDSKNETSFKRITAKGSELYSMLGISDKSVKNWRGELSLLFEGVGRCPMWVKDKEGKVRKLEYWLKEVIIHETEDKVVFQFPDFLKPYLLELHKDGCFTWYNLSNVIKLKKPTSIRIYELLTQHKDIQERIVDLDEFKQMVGSNSNDRWSDFARRYLQPAQKELKENTDITFEYTGVRSGRKVKEILFKLITVKGNSKAKTTPKPKQDTAKNVTDEKVKRLKVRLLELELSEWQIQKLIKELGVEKDGIGRKVNGYSIWKLVAEVKQAKATDTIEFRLQLF